MRVLTRAELKPFLIVAAFSAPEERIDIRALLSSEQSVYVERAQFLAVLGQIKDKYLLVWDAAKTVEVLTEENVHLGYLHLQF